MPIINWILCAGVVALVLVFQLGNKLTEIYGVAVTGTFILDTILFLAVARAVEDPEVAARPARGAVLRSRSSFFTANLAKVAHGAYLPLGVGWWSRS